MFFRGSYYVGMYENYECVDLFRVLIYELQIGIVEERRMKVGFQGDGLTNQRNVIYFSKWRSLWEKYDGLGGNLVLRFGYMMCLKSVLQWVLCFFNMLR